MLKKDETLTCGLLYNFHISILLYMLKAHSNESHAARYKIPRNMHMQHTIHAPEARYNWNVTRFRRCIVIQRNMSKSNHFRTDRTVQSREMFGLYRFNTYLNWLECTSELKHLVSKSNSIVREQLIQVWKIWQRKT